MALLMPVLSISVSAGEVKFEKIVVDYTFRAEGVATGDIDKDGDIDIFAGDIWYEAPDWKIHEIRDVGQYDGTKGYSRCFANFAQDVNGDGWIDSIVVEIPGDPCKWYENPQGKDAHWKERMIWTSACNETPIFEDLLGTGKKVLTFGVYDDQKLAWFSIPKDLEGKWDAHWISGPKSPGAERFSHGLGIGDINSDGRNDVIIIQGWYEAPEDRARTEWTFHKTYLGPEASTMFAYDVDGDGDSDVISTSAHAYGMWWFEQKKTEKGIEFKEHMICNDFSQTHAVCLVDINGDGIKDIVTGKRFFAHQGGDPGAKEPAMLYWFELIRPEPGKVKFIRHEIDSDSGVGTQFEMADMNGDGKPDVVTSNKKGVRVFIQK